MESRLELTDEELFALRKALNPDASPILIGSCEGPTTIHTTRWFADGRVETEVVKNPRRVIYNPIWVLGMF